MRYQDIIKYVDQVMDKTDVPVEYKTKLENELIRNVISASDDPNAKAADILCSPEKLAEELTKKFKNESHDDAEHGGHEEPKYYPCPPPPYPRYSGDLMLEHSNVCLKLLYIPLLQISSGTERMTMPLR